MELQEENISFIKDAFNKMKSKEDFVALLNYAKILVYGEKAIPFELKHITYHSNPRTNKKRYVQFIVKKKSGGERSIHAPAKGLKAIQKCLNLIFQAIYDVNSAATGFVPGKSIVDNAKYHTGSLYVYNVDLKDFFPSVEAGRIWGRFQHPPFNLNEKTGRKELANIITWLCCHEMEVERLDENNEWQKVKRNVLPQGTPTSPTLTNIICQQLDFYLSAVAKRFGLKYSRYADDITFSSMHNVFRKDSDFLKELHRIITVQHFHIKESKTRLQKQGYRQEVTGLLVNEKANVQKRYVKELRMWLHFWEHYGYAKANGYFLPKYKAEKGHVKKGQPNMANVIAGKLEYLKMVRGEGNEMYLKLRKRFDTLVSKSNPINLVLDIWEKEGIEKAMSAFYERSNSIFNNHIEISDLKIKAERIKNVDKKKLNDEFDSLINSSKLAFVNAPLHSSWIFTVLNNDKVTKLFLKVLKAESSYTIIGVHDESNKIYDLEKNFSFINFHEVIIDSIAITINDYKEKCIAAIINKGRESTINDFEREIANSSISWLDVQPT